MKFVYSLVWLFFFGASSSTKAGSELPMRQILPPTVYRVKQPEAKKQNGSTQEVEKKNEEENIFVPPKPDKETNSPTRN